MKTTNKCVCCESTNLTKTPAVLMPFVDDLALGNKPFQITKEMGLNTIRKGNVYTRCNTLQCQKCGHLFCDIRFDYDEMKRLYADYRGKEYTELREKYEPGYSERNEKLCEQINYIDKIEGFFASHVAPISSILDYGGDTGINTPFQKFGIPIHIYDLGNKNLEIKGTKVNKETMHNSYGLIVCSNVLEHAPYPEETIKELSNLMNDESILYIEVPLENTEKRKYHWHEHINIFNENSISYLLNYNYLDIVSSRILTIETQTSFSQVLQLACKLQEC